MAGPLAVAPVALRAAAPLASYLGHRLEGDEREKVEAGFVEAMRRNRILEEAPRSPGARWPKKKYEQAKGKLAKVRYAFPLSKKDRGAGTSGKEKSSRRGSYKEYAQIVAQQLTDAWRAAPIRVTADEPGQPEPEDFRLKEHWTRKLLYLLFEAATDAVSGNLEDSDLSEEDKARLVRAWRYVVTGDPEHTPSDLEISQWSEAIALSVVPIWRKAGLGEMLKQLNFDSHHGLMTVLAASSQDIAVSLKRFACWAIPTLLIGGGAVALLVLYIDKG